MNEWEFALKKASDRGDVRAEQLLAGVVKKRIAWFKRSVSEALNKAFLAYSHASDSENLFCWLAPHYQRMHAFEAGYQAGRKTAVKEIKRHTNKWYNQKTYVIKTSNIDRVRLLLETFGIKFKTEQHGRGPLHYSAVCEDLVLEIYPIVADKENDDYLD